MEQASELVARILEVGVSGTWMDVVAAKGTGVVRPSSAATHKRIDRARELLVRSAGGLSAERVVGSPRFRASVRATNELVVAELLLGNGASASARVSAQHAANLSNDYGNTLDEIKAVSVLRRIDAMSNLPRIVKEHDKRLRKLVERMTLENEACAIEDRVRTAMHSYSRRPKATSKELGMLVKRLEEIDTGRSPTITLARYRVTLWLYSLQAQAIDMIRVGTEAASWLDDNPKYQSISHRVEFEGSRMSAYLILKRVDEAARVWPVIESKVTLGGGNWVGLLQLYFLVCMSGSRFRAAGEALASYLEHYKSGGPLWRRQVWVIFRAYFLLLVEEGLVEPGGVKTVPRVYAGTIQSSCSDLIRDKPVWNAGVFIFQIIQWLRAHNYSAMVDATDRLRQYASRYLNSDQTGRTGVFFRALANLSIVDFNGAEAQEHFIRLTRKNTAAWSIDRDDAEIVPYEVLWGIVINILDRNKNSRRR